MSSPNREQLVKSVLRWINSALKANSLEFLVSRKHWDFKAEVTN